MRGRAHWLLPLALAAWVSLLGPWWSVYELDTDEGLNLIKARLLLGGHPLFDGIWSDQPPLLTLALSAVLRATDGSIAAARSLVLVAAGAALVCLFRIVRRLDSTRAAWVAVVAVALTSSWLRLSVSVMVGLPAVALALAALDALTASRDRASVWPAWLAGALFAASLQTKLNTLALLPTFLFVAVALGRDARGPGRGRWLPAVSFAAAAAGAFALVAVSTAEPLVSQLVEPHLRAARHDMASGETILTGFRTGLRGELHYLFLVPLGVAAALRMRRWTALVPIVWTATVFAVYAFHRPVFWHHITVVLPALGWLLARGALVVLETCRRFSSLRLARRLAIAALGVVTVASIGVSQYRALRHFHRPLAPADRDALEGLLAYKEQTRWVVTDRPIDAFYADLDVPPPLAVFSRKRVDSGALTAETVVLHLREFRPEQVVFRRFVVPEPLEDFLAGDYVELRRRTRFGHWIRRDLTRARPGAATAISETPASLRPGR